MQKRSAMNQEHQTADGPGEAVGDHRDGWAGATAVEFVVLLSPPDGRSRVWDTLTLPDIATAMELWAGLPNIWGVIYDWSVWRLLPGSDGKRVFAELKCSQEHADEVAAGKNPLAAALRSIGSSRGYNVRFVLDGELDERRDERLARRLKDREEHLDDIGASELGPEPPWHQAKERALERDGRKCVQCDSEEDLEVDHICEQADGGSNYLENLQTLCKSCHHKKTAESRRARRNSADSDSESGKHNTPAESVSA